MVAFKHIYIYIYIYTDIIYHLEVNSYLFSKCYYLFYFIFTFWPPLKIPSLFYNQLQICIHICLCPIKNWWKEPSSCLHFSLLSVSSVFTVRFNMEDNLCCYFYNISINILLNILKYFCSYSTLFFFFNNPFHSDLSSQYSRKVILLLQIQCKFKNV